MWLESHFDEKCVQDEMRGWGVGEWKKNSHSKCNLFILYLQLWICATRVKRRDPFFDKWRSQCAQNAIHFCWWQLVKYLFHLMVNHSSRAHILCTLTSLRLQCSASPSIFQLYSLIVTAKKNSLMMGIYSECWQTREWHPFWRPQRRVLLPSILYEGTLRTSLFFIWFCTKGDNISGVLRG